MPRALWLTPLTGATPQTLNGAWSDVLDQAYQVLHAREESSAGGEDETLQSIITMLSMARRNASEGNLHQATVSLGYCETLAQRL
ncbi:hypothetical protein ACFPH6_49360 [Streptomyces xiangluensis]|uniref:Uncharacterized protein n=1 Tax=Streptomyces xiangluensis TaxID=2665720 RepID=A0ABV8ZAQ0_9ACTN